MPADTHNNMLGGYIGSYRITDVIGRGGFGIVYRAYQPFLEREVAIKVIQTAVHTSERREQQFMAEARTIARLRHPNIVTVYEFGTAEQDHTPFTYMVMEYLPGTTLDSLLRQRTLTMEQVVEITYQLADALTYAHGNSVVHRDLKPANILFSDQHQPVIVDFGLAMLMEVSAGDQDTILASSTMGTPPYMAPEQVLSLRGGPASDQYALAVIVYEMLTRTLPFKGDNVKDLFAAKLEGTFKPITEIVPNIPPAIDAVMQRALSIDPTARYPRAQDFARALGEALLPERQTHRTRTVTITDPIQEMRLRSARQTVLGFMWGMMLLTSVIVAFCLTLCIRGYTNAEGAFIWDGILTSIAITEGMRDVVGLVPDSPAAKAGVQLGDRIKTDISREMDEKDGDYTVNGQPRSSYPVRWVPQAGDVIERTVIRAGVPINVRYTLERSPLNLVLMLSQLPTALLMLFCATWLLRRWGAETGIQIFVMVLMAGTFTMMGAVVTFELPNLITVALFLLLPLMLHLILMFPEPLPYLEQYPRRIWWIYLPFPIALLEFLWGEMDFMQFNVIFYVGYALLIVAASWLKWARQDIKRYPDLKLLLVASAGGTLTVLLANGVAAFDDYKTIQLVWGGDGMRLLAFAFGVSAIGTAFAVILSTVGIHRMQQIFGRTLVTPQSNADLPDVANTIIFNSGTHAPTPITLLVTQTVKPANTDSDDNVTIDLKDDKTQ